jgi:transcriptional regulator with XRE-family HTH domain
MAKIKKYVELGQKIKDLRAFLGGNIPITQTAFGVRLRVSRSRICSWEAGKEKPAANKLIALARLSPGPESLYFWQQAGVDPSEIENGLRLKMLRSGERVALREVVDVRKLNARALLRTEISDDEAAVEVESFIPFPRAFVPDPTSTFSIQATGSAGSGFSGGDLVLVRRTRSTGAPPLNHFVAVLSEELYLNRYLTPEARRGLPRGRLLTERDKKQNELNEPRDPFERAERDKKDEELWAKCLQTEFPDILFGVLCVQNVEEIAYLRFDEIKKGDPWRLLLDCGNFRSPLSLWTVEEFQYDAILAALEKAKIHILGEVIGWLRAPGNSVSESVAEGVEPRTEEK